MSGEKQPVPLFPGDDAKPNRSWHVFIDGKRIADGEAESQEAAYKSVYNYLISIQKLFEYRTEIGVRIADRAGQETWFKVFTVFKMEANDCIFVDNVTKLKWNPFEEGEPSRPQTPEDPPKPEESSRLWLAVRAVHRELDTYWTETGRFERGEVGPQRLEDALRNVGRAARRVEGLVLRAVKDIRTGKGVIR